MKLDAEIIALENWRLEMIQPESSTGRLSSLRLKVLFGALVTCSVASGCGPGRIEVVEAYVLDVVILDSKNRILKGVTVGVRTQPEADGLDLVNISLVTRDGDSFEVQSFGGGEVTHTKPMPLALGDTKWILFRVPESAIEAGDLSLYLNESGITIPLPSTLESRSIDDLDGS